MGCACRTRSEVRADVAVECGSHLAIGVHGIGQFIDQEVERHVDVLMRVFTLLAEIERRRRQALGEGFGLSQQRPLAIEHAQERCGPPHVQICRFIVQIDLLLQ